MLSISKGASKGAVKAVIYGVEGVGKTTFAGHFPKPLFLDLDRGSERMEVDRINTIETWEALATTLAEIYATPSLPYSTIVIDTADMAAKLCTDFVCKVNGNKKSIEEFGYGKGYVILAHEFSTLLVQATTLVDAGYNVVFLAHAMQRTVTKPDDTGSYDHWEMKLPGKGNNSIGGLLKEWADLLLFADYNVIIRKGDDGKGKAAGGQRRMRANHTAFADAKNRFSLPDLMDFDYKEIAAVIPERIIPKEKPMTELEKAYKAKKDFQEAQKAEPTPLERLREKMQAGVSDADPAPITESELLKAIHTVEKDPTLQAAEKLEDLPVKYVESLLPEDQWSGLRMYILNNIRVPF